MNSFGHRIRELRESKSLPLRKVAAYLDLDTSVLSKIERDERPASKKIVVLLAEFFDLDQTELMTDFLGDKVARNIYGEVNTEEILKVAEEKVKYYRNYKTEQGSIFK